MCQLPQKGTRLHWRKQQLETFEKSKKLLESSKVLVHYSPHLPLILSCDASPYGLGAILSHQMPNGVEKPIVFASRTLSKAEKKYAQIEREGLAIVFAVTKFHKYLFGRAFSIKTDHKPLLGLLRENKTINALASARMQRWGLKLSNYQYTLQHQPGSCNQHADALSRLPIFDKVSSASVTEETVLSFATLNNTPVTAHKIAKWTSRDPVLSTVYRYVMQGWPSTVSAEMNAYYHRRNELSTHQGCLLWGSRVIIPTPGREPLLNELHEGHPGIVKMKVLARSYMWWPGIDGEIDSKVRNCTQCQQHRKNPPNTELHPWEWPGRPWYGLHIDFAGPIDGKMILISVDAHSKYIDAHVMSSATSNGTINALRSFATHGIPNVVVSDNWSCFTSADFPSFCKQNGIKHIKTSPYHLANNGHAKREQFKPLSLVLRKCKEIWKRSFTDFY